MGHILQLAIAPVLAVLYLVGLLAFTGNALIWRESQFLLAMSVLWPAEFACGGWVLGIALMLLRKRWEPGSQWVRAIQWIWMCGSLTMIAHIVISMGQVHGWSVWDAYRETERVSGFGAGVYVNFLFAVVWFVDATWLFLTPMHYARRPRWIRGAIHGFLAFMVFNAIVVFVPWDVALLGGVWFLLIATAWMLGCMPTRTEQPLH